MRSFFFNSLGAVKQYISAHGTHLVPSNYLVGTNWCIIIFWPHELVSRKNVTRWKRRRNKRSIYYLRCGHWWLVCVLG